MASSGILAFAIVVLLAVINTGSCLNCYQCNTQQDKACGDPFTSTKSVDCNTQDSVKYNQVNLFGILPADLFTSVTGAPRYCHKIITESGTTIRTCLDSNPSDLEQSCRLFIQSGQTVTKEKKIKHCSVCNKDNCNGAGSLTYSLPLAAFALIASYLFYKQ